MIRVPGDFEHDGRLGNQLFQIAATVGIAASEGQRPSVPAEWSYRPWFSLPDEWYESNPVYMRPADLYAPHLPEPYRIYLQDPSLWSDSADIVRRAFAPSDLIADKVRSWRKIFTAESPVLAVHVRRADNVTNEPGTIEALPLRYYQDALDAIDFDRAVTVAFSDDPQWCRDNLLGKYVDWVFDESKPRPKEHADDYMTAPITDWLDLFVMARCNAHIISNSSYAWWGAWLANSKRVIYPSYWYGEQLTDAGADPSLLFKGLDWQMLETQPERLSC